MPGAEALAAEIPFSCHERARGRTAGPLVDVELNHGVAGAIAGVGHVYCHVERCRPLRASVWLSMRLSNENDV